MIWPIFWIFCRQNRNGNETETKREEEINKHISLSKMREEIPNISILCINLIASHTANHEERSTFFRAGIVITRIIQYIHNQHRVRSALGRSFFNHLIQILFVFDQSSCWPLFGLFLGRPKEKKNNILLTNHWWEYESPFKLYSNTATWKILLIHPKPNNNSSEKIFVLFLIGIWLNNFFKWSDGGTMEQIVINHSIQIQNQSSRFALIHLFFIIIIINDKCTRACLCTYTYRPFINEPNCMMKWKLETFFNCHCWPHFRLSSICSNLSIYSIGYYFYLITVKIYLMHEHSLFGILKCFSDLVLFREMGPRKRDGKHIDPTDQRDQCDTVEKCHEVIIFNWGYLSLFSIKCLCESIDHG